MPGLGVMINAFGSNGDEFDPLRESIGKVITNLAITKDEIRIVFSDNTTLRVWDDGQSCCEKRYITTDSDLTSAVGQLVQNYSLDNGPSVTDEWGDEHETQFFRVKTNLETFTFTTHNEHNGYYGGFWLRSAWL